MLAVVGAKTEKGTELVISSAEPLGGSECLEAAHTSDPAFEAPVILLESIIQIGAGPVLYMPAEC
jgi:hypothetical protein